MHSSRSTEAGCHDFVRLASKERDDGQGTRDLTERQQPTHMVTTAWRSLTKHR